MVLVGLVVWVLFGIIKMMAAEKKVEVVADGSSSDFFTAYLGSL